MEDRTIKEILQDHLDSFLEEGALHIHREQSIEYISGKGVVITGIRRSGKSTFLKQFYQGLAANLSSHWLSIFLTIDWQEAQRKI